MNNDIKRELRKKSQMIRGLANLLKADADYICADADDFDLIRLGVSIDEVKDTIQRLIDNVAELEYAIYLSKQNGA